MNITLNIVRSFFSYNVISVKHEKMFVRRQILEIKKYKKQKESNTTQLWENVITFTCLWSLLFQRESFIINFFVILVLISQFIFWFIYMWIHAIYIHYYMFCSLSFFFFFLLQVLTIYHSKARAQEYLHFGEQTK